MKFIFGIHNHQPVGNFDFVFEEAFQKSYKPFIDLIEKYQSIKFVMHLSGPLIEWLEDHHSDFIDKIAKIVESDHCEMISSGFYEPILISISDSDKIGQIQMMNEYIQKRFGKKPEGLWLTERIWEPGLVKPIVESGIKYVAVDDQHFSTSGTPIDKLNGYYLTEDQGFVLGVFPISQKLRYAIPFEQPEQTIKILQHNSRNKDSVMVLADDGEKFGVWPGTHELCFGHENWLKQFFNTLSKNQDWLKTTTFSDYFNSHKSSGRVYLPTSSYFEMSEWTLPTMLGRKFNQHIDQLKSQQTFDEIRPYLKGGTWRDFLTKYDESNWMLKRSNQVSAMVADDEDLEIQKSTWKSQCNCAFWHGVFGGLYLPHLRHAIYSNIIKAEKQVNSATFDKTDLDHDGHAEFIISNDQIRLFITPIGGAIREIDFLPVNFNLVNTLSRYEEHYHHKLLNAQSQNEQKTASIHDVVKVKQVGLENLLFIDKHRRWMAQDHFFADGLEVSDVQSNEYDELGDFINDDYSLSHANSSVLTSRSGIINGIPLYLKKKITLKDNRIIFDISIENVGTEILQSNYGIEFNFSLLGGHAPDRYYLFDDVKPKSYYLDSIGKRRMKSISLLIEWEGIQSTLIFENKTEIWRYPIETVSMSEAGFEKVYQSSVVLPVWKLNLKPQEFFNKSFELEISNLQKRN